MYDWDLGYYKLVAFSSAYYILSREESFLSPHNTRNYRSSCNFSVVEYGAFVGKIIIIIIILVTGLIEVDFSTLYLSDVCKLFV